MTELFFLFFFVSSLQPLHPFIGYCFVLFFLSLSFVTIIFLASFPYFVVLFLPPHPSLILPSLWSHRHWVQSWPRPETKPRRHRMTSYMPRMWKRAEINTKRCARSDRATRSSASMNLSPCETGTHVPPRPCFPLGCLLPNFPLSGCSIFMDNRCCRPCNPPRPPQCTKEIVRNHLIKNCQSLAPHVDSEISGYLRHMELPQHHSNQANTILLQKLSLILKRVYNQNGSNWIFLFWENMAIESYFCCFLFCLTTCMQRFSMTPCLQFKMNRPLLVFKLFPSAFVWLVLLITPSLFFFSFFLSCLLNTLMQGLVPAYE